jgi:hypothetical protein
VQSGIDIAAISPKGKLMRKNLLQVLVGLLFVTSCARDAQEQSVSDFIVDEVNHISTMTFKTTKSSGLEELKDLARIQTKICMKDPVVGAAIIGESFSITDGITSQNKKTDFQGCFNFELRSKFDFLSCEKYENRKITISARGNYLGTSTLDLMVNPTADNGNIVVDTRYNYPAKIAEHNCERTSLKIRLNKVSRIKSTTDKLSLKFELTPTIQRHKIDNQFKKHEIKSQGQFTVEASINTYIDGELMVLAKESTGAYITDGRIQSILNFNANELINNDSSSYILQLKVTPISDKRLVPFIGQLESNDLFFNKTSTLEEKGQALTVNSFKKSEIRAEGIIGLKEITVKESSNINEDDFSKNKKKQVIMSACFFNKLSQYGNEPIVDLNVQIETMKYEVDVLTNTTDEEGCIDFKTNLKYDIFKASSWEKENIRFYIHENGEVRNIERSVALNPKHPQVLRDLEYSKVFEEEISKATAKLSIGHIEYKQVGNVDSTFYINKFAQLFFNKKYSFKINPSVEISDNYRESGKLKSLNFGKIKTKIHLYSTDKEVRSSETIDFSRMTLVTTTQASANVDKHGTYYIEPEFPLEISDTLNLSVRMIAVIELIPEDGLEGLEARNFVFDFHGMNKANKENVFLLTEEIPTEDILEISKIAKNNSQYHQGLSGKDSSLDSIDIYRKQLKGIYKDDIKFLNYEQLIRSTDGQRAGLKMSELRLMAQSRGVLPKAGKTREKICRMHMIEKGFFSTNIEECVDNFDKHFKVMGATHITDIIGMNKYETENQVTKAHLIKGSEVRSGSINRGTAFMAAQGDRASHDYGSRDSLAESYNASLYYDGPPSVFMLSAGITKTHETFSTETNAKMQLSFNRNFSSLTKVKLRYESFAAIFTAKTRRCILIEDIKQKSAKHICENEDQFKDVVEKWYFLGEQNDGKGGIITDGLDAGETGFLRVVRGEENFKQIWAKFEDEDQRAIIQTMKGFKLGDKFKQLKRTDEIDLKYEIYKDNSFPGLLN